MGTEILKEVYWFRWFDFGLLLIEHSSSFLFFPRA